MVSNGIIVILGGLVGAAISYTISTTVFSSQPVAAGVLETMISNMAPPRLQPILHRALQGISDLVPASVPAVANSLVVHSVTGFVMGCAFILICIGMRIMIVRFLLSCNGWFFTPKNPINKIWYALMLLLVGRKNLGAGNYQQLLPSLPVPSLDETLRRYLDSIQPLVSADEYKQAEKAAKNFKRQGGRKLQFYLKLRSWTMRNWMADWWTKYIYLKQRSPISFNSNYFASGCRIPKTRSQLDRAAMMMYLGIVGGKNYFAGKFKNMTAQSLVPFCMDSMPYTASTCRIPGAEEDKLVNYDMRKKNFFIVFRKGKMFKLTGVDASGNPLPPAMLKDQLQQIVELTGDEVCEDGYMASFTSLPRTKWAEIRERLLKDPVNRESLEAIQSCFAIYVLADEAPEDGDYTSLASELFHGRGHDHWVDKCISVIVFANGNIGVCVEHSALDATVCGQFWEYMLYREHYDENGHVPELTEKEKKKLMGTKFKVEQLKWNLEDFKEDIQESKAHYQEMVDDSDLIVLQPSYSKRFPKQCKLSPDGWFQMALQLTYYRLHKKFVLTYESATTRLYYKGRTETIRPVSEQSKKWVEAMMNDSASVEDKKRFLKEAIAVQEKRKFEAMRCMGVDRHLFGLYVVSQWLKMDPLPDLFTDKSFSLPFTLSTSQTPVNFVEQYNKENACMIGGFGTVVKEGYGVSYFVNNDDLVLFVIHSRKCCPDTSSSKFAQTLYQTLEDMKELYETNK